MAVARYGDVSFWHDRLRASSLEPRAPLPGDRDVDVAIIGGGFTGLWTAYYLLQADPSIRVAILERDIAGFGASGRNGGWCLGELAVPVPRLARAVGRESAVASTILCEGTLVRVIGAAIKFDHQPFLHQQIDPANSFNPHLRFDPEASLHKGVPRDRFEQRLGAAVRKRGEERTACARRDPESG